MLYKRVIWGGENDCNWYWSASAEKIIISTAVLDSIHEGPSVNEIQGVPFDFIGVKNNNIYIVEL